MGVLLFLGAGGALSFGTGFGKCSAFRSTKRKCDHGRSPNIERKAQGAGGAGYQGLPGPSSAYQDRTARLVEGAEGGWPFKDSERKFTSRRDYDFCWLEAQSFSAMRTRSARDSAFIFCMMWARWNLIVR